METHSLTIRDEIRAALVDPELLGFIAKSVATAVAKELREENQLLKRKLDEQAKEISLLYDKVDELEQYGRRNAVRIGPLPEKQNENTNDVVIKVAAHIGVTITNNDISRSHRVGRKLAPNDSSGRSIICKFTSYRVKNELMRARKNLKGVRPDQLFPDLDWPALPRRREVGLYINEDLTQVRANVASRARKLKRENIITDTWTRDGLIFIKKGDNVRKITTLREIDSLTQ